MSKFNQNLSYLKEIRGGKQEFRPLQDEIVKLYSEHKIPNYKTAAKIINQLSANHKASNSKGIKLYEQLKQKDLIPLTGRLKREQETIQHKNIQLQAVKTTAASKLQKAVRMKTRFTIVKKEGALRRHSRKKTRNGQQYYFKV
jgi:hypothetical protein